MNASVPPEQVSPPGRDDSDSARQKSAEPAPSPDAGTKSDGDDPAGGGAQSVRRDDTSQPSWNEAGERPPGQHGATNSPNGSRACSETANSIHSPARVARRGFDGRRRMTRPRAVNATVRRASGFLAGRAARIGLTVTLLSAAAIPAALAGTGTGTQSTVRSPGPEPALVSPGGTGGPGALPVAEPHAGATWTDHQLVVRVHGWTAATDACAARNIPDTQGTSASRGGCGASQLTTAAPAGYGAAQLRAYLRLQGSGAGQAVAIVDAFDNPYASTDITAYSRQFGLPVPCGANKQAKSGCFKFSVVHPYGFNGVDAGWALESDLDVQMVHAIAPRASITLVEAYDNSYVSMLQAISYAAARKPAPAVISNSWGGPEFAGETAADQHCALARTLCVFAAGDSGNPGWYPAFDPYVLSVGGTHLELTPAGQVSLEGGWCCAPFPGAATGGGVSQYLPRPAYQDAANPYPKRGIPDVSFDADPFTGVAVHDTFGLDDQNGWFEVGGTSVGTPAWAGILAAADQLRVAEGKKPLAGAGFQALKLIYAMPHAAGFADITQGSNNMFQCNAALGTPALACQAHPGYDLVTGWGSPRPGIDTALSSAP